MIQLNEERIAKLPQSKLYRGNRFDQSEIVQHWVYDSRKISHPHQACFIVLEKDDLKAKRYMRAAYKQGIRIFWTKQKHTIPAEDCLIIYSQDVLRSLQYFAALHRSRFNIPVIGITGSNGKTIVKEWLAQLLDSTFHVCKSPASYNSQLGVPLSLLQLDNSSEISVFEAGISKENEMIHLQKMIQPTLGIFTNIGDAHSQGFSSKKTKALEKLNLFKDCEYLIYPSDDSLLHQVINDHYTGQKLDYSFINPLSSFLVSIVLEKITITNKDQEKFHFTFPLQDPVSQANIIPVILAGLHLGLDPQKINNNIGRFQTISMRMHMHRGADNCLIINDSYNADLTSFKEAINFAKVQQESRKLELILTDFEEINYSQEIKKEFDQIIQSSQADSIHYIGNQLNIDHPHFYHYSDLKELRKTLKNQSRKNTLYLLKGARKYRLERLLALFSIKTHRTNLFISLQAIRQNIKTYRSLIPKNTRIMAVIKASAYGSESVSLARFLLNQGVEYLATAYVEEAVELREEGIETPILVMNPDPLQMDLIQEFNLDVEIYSLNQLSNILHYSTDTLKVHLKIDSGMHRLGLVEEDINDLRILLDQHKNVKIKSIFSHFSSVDDPTEDAFTHQQFEKYIDLYKKIENILGESPLKHICNSTATLRFPQYHLDMVRLGIGLYGYAEYEGMEMAHRLTSYVGQVKQIHAGDSVGYNRQFISDSDMQIATVNIGYADGLPRKLGKGNYSFKIHGKWCPTIGNISMDTCSIDVSGLNVRAGDEVIIFDDAKSFKHFCEVTERISYEAICALGPRVHRFFIQE